MEGNITISRIYLSTILMTLITFSCRTSKQKQEQLTIQTKTQESLRISSDRFVWQQRDSSQSYWILQTDSLLYYHPKWGVWAQGGVLLGNQTQGQQSSVVMKKDSIVRNTEQEEQVRYISYWSRQVKENWGLIIVAAVLVVVWIIFGFIKPHRL